MVVDTKPRNTLGQYGAVVQISQGGLRILGLISTCWYEGRLETSGTRARRGGWVEPSLLGQASIPWMSVTQTRQSTMVEGSLHECRRGAITWLGTSKVPTCANRTIEYLRNPIKGCKTSEASTWHPALSTRDKPVPITTVSYSFRPLSTLGKG